MALPIQPTNQSPSSNPGPAAAAAAAAAASAAAAAAASGQGIGGVIGSAVVAGASTVGASIPTSQSVPTEPSPTIQELIDYISGQNNNPGPITLGLEPSPSNPLGLSQGY